MHKQSKNWPGVQYPLKIRKIWTFWLGGRCGDANTIGISSFNPRLTKGGLMQPPLRFSSGSSKTLKKVTKGIYLFYILCGHFHEKKLGVPPYPGVHGIFHVKHTLLFSQRVKIQLLSIHSKHMVLWPSGCTKLSSKILEHGIIFNILKSSLKFSMEKCTASGEDILFNNVNLATLKLWYASMKEWMVIWAG